MKPINILSLDAKSSSLFSAISLLQERFPQRSPPLRLMLSVLQPIPATVRIRSLHHVLCLPQRLQFVARHSLALVAHFMSVLCIMLPAQVHFLILVAIKIPLTLSLSWPMILVSCLLTIGHFCSAFGSCFFLTDTDRYSLQVLVGKCLYTHPSAQGLPTQLSTPSK